MISAMMSFQKRDVKQGRKPAPGQILAHHIVKPCESGQFSRRHPSRRGGVQAFSDPLAQHQQTAVDFRHVPVAGERVTGRDGNGTFARTGQVAGQQIACASSEAFARFGGRQPGEQKGHCIDKDFHHFKISEFGAVDADFIPCRRTPRKPRQIDIARHRRDDQQRRFGVHEAGSVSACPVFKVSLWSIKAARAWQSRVISAARDRMRVQFGKWAQHLIVSPSPCR